jgi:hypothetical protein
MKVYKFETKPIDERHTVFEIEHKGYAIPFVQVYESGDTYYMDLMFSRSGRFGIPIMSIHDVDIYLTDLRGYLKMFFEDKSLYERYAKTNKDKAAWRRAEKRAKSEYVKAKSSGNKVNFTVYKGGK